MNRRKLCHLGTFLALGTLLGALGCQDHSKSPVSAHGDGHSNAQQVDKHSNPHGEHGKGHFGHSDDHQKDSKQIETRMSIAEGTFPTIGFEDRHEVEIPFPVSDVLPLFQPEGRYLMYRWWKPKVLREAKASTLKGQMSVANMHSHDILLIVTEHEPEQGHIQYLVLWDDFELQRIDITCAEGDTKNSTKVVWNERNAGLHENGVAMVSKFVTGGHLKSKVTPRP